MECITPVVEYVESQLQRSSTSDGISDADLTTMLSGNGGAQVDVVLYVILHSNFSPCPSHNDISDTIQE